MANPGRSTNVLRILVLDVLVAVSPILVGLGAYVLVRLLLA